jgi:hypothetical protein
MSARGIPCMYGDVGRVRFDALVLRCADVTGATIPHQAAWDSKGNGIDRRQEQSDDGTWLKLLSLPAHLAAGHAGFALP